MLNQADGMERAAAALKAVGLNLHKPMKSTIGASNEWVMALINCDEKDGKLRVSVSVASNPQKRGESYRVCTYLIEYMKTGKPPADAVFKNYAGIWEWKYVGYAGSGKVTVTLHPDGKATATDPGWSGTTWWSEDGKVFVYPPSSFPKSNLHYVYVFAVAADGKSMELSAPNYYLKSIAATRVGDAPGSTGSGGETAPAGGTTAQEDSRDGPLLHAPKLPPAPLPLPPIGAMRAKKTEVPTYGAAPDQQRSPCSIVSVQAVHVPETIEPERFSGRIMVEVTLSNPGELFVADVYVGGYLASPTTPAGGSAGREGPLGGIYYDGWVPGYEYKRLHSSTDANSPRPGTVRRVVFNMPKVLPASIRVELYEQKRESDVFVEKEEATFTMPFPDIKVVQGQLRGVPEGKISELRVLPDGAEEVLIVIPVGDDPKKTSQDIRFRGRRKPGEYAINGKYDIGLSGKERWKEMTMHVFPDQRDRDHRNNWYWPNLPNGGYRDEPPVFVRR